MSLLEDNLDKLVALFPNIITEVRGEDGKLKRAVNFEMLKLMFTPDEIADGREYYSFTWAGKRNAIIEAGKPTDKVLRPCIEESKNFETTHNLYIEGENLEVLKIIQLAYMNKIKFIYIDPPYNTGHDFIYSDNYRHNQNEDVQQFELFNEEGEKNFSSENYRENIKSNPRFHSDWCSMIYPRLIIARNVLRDDGIIFISIDDNEAANLKKICDEIFGEDNFVAQLVWDLGTGTTAGLFTRGHEYIIVYAKNKMNLSNFTNYEEGANIIHGALKKISRKNPAVEITFPVGFEFDGNDAVFTGEIGDAEKEYILSDEMRFENGKLVAPATLRAGFAMKNQILDYIAGREVYDTKGQRVKRFFFNARGILFYEKEKTIINPRTVLSNIANTKNGTNELDKMLGGTYFPFPKSTELIKYLIQLTTNNDSIVLDFFSGSATTPHAVMNLNHEDGGNRKFIMVQIQEPCKPESEAAKAGFTNICEIGKERIRRAGENLKGDTGFRVLKLDSSNMRDVYIQPESLTRLILDDLIENIKPDRTGIDLLFECITRFGMPLSLAYRSENVNGFTVHTYGDNLIAACFDENINEELIKNMARRKPQRAVFRDSCFENAAVKINLEQIFRFYAPHTDIKVL